MRETILNTVLAALAAFSVASCSGKGERHEAQAEPPRALHSEEEPGAHEEHAAEEETSDLDRPVDELFAATCEHGKKTHECDECRYEVGVVKAPADLFEGGLLRSATVEKRRVEVPLLLTGEVQFDERRVVHVSSQAEGIIHKVHATVGDRVQRGQPLVEIDIVELGEAQAAYLEARGMLGLARRNLERLEMLRQEGIVSEREYFQAQQELEAAEIRSGGALGKLTRLGMAESEARSLTQETATGRLVLRAPASGRVLEMHAVPGEVAKTEAPLVTVGDNAALWVWADLYERDLSTVTRAQARQSLSVLVSVRAYPDEEFPGTVDFISPSMNTASRTVKLRIAVDNPAGKLVAGMFANIKLFLPGEDQATVVPRDAVLEDEGRAFVFIRQQGEYFVRREVEPGRAFAGWLEITAGPDVGQEIVADGAFILKSDVLRSKMGAGCAD